MKQVDDKELWIKEVTESIGGIQRPDANPFLYEKIMYTMRQGGNTAYTHVRNNAIGWAIAVVLLLAVNSFSIVNKISHERRALQAEAMNPVMQEMQTQTIYNY